MHFIRTTGLAVALLPLALMTANAGVIIGGTRIIFEGAKKEATINITNPDNTPYLIQSWIDMQDGGRVKRRLLLRRRCIAWTVDKKTLSVL